MSVQKLIVGVDGSSATSLKADYKGTPFKDLKASGELRDFGANDPNYKADAATLIVKNAYPTNIWRLLAGLEDKDKDGNDQLCQYFPGVATTAIPKLEDISILLRLMQMSFGVEAPDRITQTYIWLCSVYKESVKNKIIFVGWSRGAFTVRAVGGMVSRYGILRAADGNYKSDAFKKLVDKLRATYFKENIDKAGMTSKIKWCREDTGLAVTNVSDLGVFKPAEIEAYACWETVGSLGVPLSRWHKAVLDNPFCTEVMKPFKDKLKDWGTDVEDPMTFEHFYDQQLPPGTKFAFHVLALNEFMEPFRPTLWEKPGANTQLVQCWFPGDHIDVGSAHADRQIPDITLAWMMTQLEKNGVLKFKPKYIKDDVFPQSKAIATKEKYTPKKWGHGETRSMYNMIDGAAGRLTVGAVLGSLARDPGNYHRLNNDGTHSSDLLQNTNEVIHKSVRVRVEAKTGLGANGKSDYAPRALSNWKTPSEGKYYWNGYFSHVPPFLVEPPLEMYEKEVYDLYGA